MKRFSLAEDRAPFRAQVRHHHRSGSPNPAWKHWIDDRPRSETGGRRLFRLSLTLLGLMVVGALVVVAISLKLL